MPKRNPRDYDFSTIFNLFSQFHELDTAFCYRGAFSEQFTGTILEISEGSSFRTSSHLNRKVSFLLVECFQNIIKHGENIEVEQTEDDGLFSFRLTTAGFTINSINHLLTEEVQTLRSWVDQLNLLDSASLKKLYLQQLSNNELSKKGGAGLGLIELARKSGQKLQYQFELLDERYSRFHQQVSFISSGESDNAPDSKIEDTKSLYQTMMDENALILYKGDFSQKSILPLLSIVEQNVGNGKPAGGVTRKVAHILIELLQNISKHALADERNRKEGIFTIGLDGHHVYLQCGNLISAEDMEFIGTNLDYLTSLNDQELAELHKNAMKASLKFENKFKSGLGLIEIVKAAKVGVNYTFKPMNAETFLFALKVSF